MCCAGVDFTQIAKEDQTPVESKKSFWHDLFYTMLVLGAAVAVCSLLSQMHDDNNPFAVLIFVLAVAVVALVTNSYLWVWQPWSLGYSASTLCLPIRFGAST